jgi:hypothetical protein
MFMDAEILNSPPVSGEYEEHSFAVSGNTLWVKFLDEAYLEWVGVFEQSEWKKFNIVMRVPNENLFLVVAGGQGYFVNPNSRKIVAKTEWDDIENIIYNEETGYFVATDGLRLALFKGSNLYWSGERVSADGIYFKKQKGPVIEGILNDLTTEGCKFEFNAKTQEFKSDWIFSENWG